MLVVNPFTDSLAHSQSSMLIENAISGDKDITTIHFNTRNRYFQKGHCDHLAEISSLGNIQMHKFVGAYDHNAYAGPNMSKVVREVSVKDQATKEVSGAAMLEVKNGA